ncbi:KilA-N domain-containing protein [Neisseria bacilliformis]|uniref:KilA-N domain-containing protein n=1 Tax=Neisseria bacilliformis TaxID=267212 RepID=UPI0028F0AF7C|nr:KilA-N domain-containing protein [Neisseria bacilliformis]
MNAIQISNVTIRQTENNLYNLNDLHKAAGGADNHKPSQWLRIQQTQELIAEIESCGDRAAEVVHGGKNRGTFVCKELVYAYATWISAKFFLLVIRTFDAVVTGRLKSESPTSVDERTPLRQAVSALVGLRRVDYSTAYNMVHQRFGVDKIEDLPRERLPEAVRYVHALTLDNALSGEVLDAVAGRPRGDGVPENVVRLIASLLQHLPYQMAYFRATEQAVASLRPQWVFRTHDRFQDGMILARQLADKLGLDFLPWREVRLV